MKNTTTLLIAAASLLALPVQAGNPALDDLRAKYAAALVALRNDQTNQGQVAMAQEVDAALKQHQAATNAPSTTELLTKGRWVRRGMGDMAFTFNKDGSMSCGKPSKFQVWAVQPDGSVTMGNPGWQVVFHMQANGKGLVAHQDGLLIYFEAQ